MLYYDANNETITQGLSVLRNEANEDGAHPRIQAYYYFLRAISIGKGFDFLCDRDEAVYLTTKDLFDILKELLYAIENERITDRHTHKNIVEETLETLLDIYL